MKQNSKLQKIRRMNSRLRQLSRASNDQQQQEEIDASERRKRVAGGLAGVAGLTVASRKAAPKIGSLGSSGMKRVADQLAKFPLRGGRILSGGALAQALKKIRK